MHVRRIELATLESIPRRVESIKKSLEIIYNVELQACPENILTSQLSPTEDFLENDKLALVFMKAINEGYNVPIIAANHGEDCFVLDGHHRSFILTKLGEKTIKAMILKFPSGSSYRYVPKTSIEDLPIKAVGMIEDPILKAWGRILNILKQYETLHHIHFYMKQRALPLRKVHPTQPQILRVQLDSIDKILVPIACIEACGEYYVIDGHARCVRAKQLGLESILAIALSPQINVDFGVIKTAKDMGLRDLDDIAIVE